MSAPEQEPVAEKVYDQEDDTAYIQYFIPHDLIPIGTKFYTTPPQPAPDYKVLWEQMCERCDELDKKLAHPEHEPVAYANDDWSRIDFPSGKVPTKGGPIYTTPPQRTWGGLMRGVRVESDTVVISVKGRNDAARELCGALIEEMTRAIEAANGTKGHS